MLMADYVHDLGNWQFPPQYWKERPAREYERAVIKGTAIIHTILQHIKEFGPLVQWAATTSADGKGYPSEFESYLPRSSDHGGGGYLYRTARGKDLSRGNGKEGSLDIIKWSKNAPLTGIWSTAGAKLRWINHWRQVSQKQSMEEYAVMNPLFVRKIERGLGGR